MNATPELSNPKDQELARLRAENESLRSQFEESQETLRAIREGAVDALVIDTPEGQRVFTLQGGEHPYRALIEQMREGAVTLTPDGIVHYCNQRFAEMLKLPLEQVMGAQMEQFVASADRAALAAMLGERAGRADLALVAGDRTEVPVLVSATALRDDGPTAVCLVVSDLTERKRAEAAALAQRQRLYDVLETLPAMICLLTADHHVAFANRSFREKFGASHGGLCYEYCFGRTEPCAFCESYEVLKTGQPHHWEVTGEDGSIMDAYDFPFTDVDGSPMVLEMDMDITERRKTEAELARHRERLEELVRERTAGLETANLGLQEEIASRTRAEESLARSARQRTLLEELSARVVAQRSVDELLATVVEAARELTAARLSVSGHGYTGGEFRVGKASCAGGEVAGPPSEVFKVEKGGVYLDVIHGGPSLRLSGTELHNHPAWWGLPEGHGPLRGLLGARLVDARNEPCGLIMVSDKEGGGEFTEEDEARLRQLASITSLALGHIEARTAAEAANAAKSRFLANMSHELRTPMNAIMGMLDVALPKATDPTVQDCLQTAKRSADLLLTLLNDLLDSAKIESGKLDLESAPFSLRRVLDQTAEVLAVRASEKRISFSTRIPPDLPDVFIGDQLRLRQILLNLAGNGIKFTESGEVAVSVRQVEGLKEGSGRRDWGLEDAQRRARSHSPPPIPDPQSPIPAATLEFAVRDTGIGISRSDLEHLFQPFAQADHSIARRFGGTGLGLTICSNLVTLMGGRIWAESEPGQGSTFHFTVRLPLAKELPPESKTPEVAATAAAALRILLVEDNPANQKLAAYILQERGHTIEIAGNGEQGLRLARENQYHVILMDVQMPDMDGLEVTAAIRAGEAQTATGKGDSFHLPERPEECLAQMGTVPLSEAKEAKRVPIIAMTAHAMKGDRERCLAGGMDGYLPKPIDAREMIALVESLAAALPSAVAPIPLAHGPRQPVGASSAVVFDPALALKRCFGKPDLLAQMIQFFFDDIHELLPQVHLALQRGDLTGVGALGHRLKGTISHLAAERAKEAALYVERVGLLDGKQAEAEEAVKQLERECQALGAALAEHQAATAPAQRD
jgi:PAS domain S-box-containing protein